MVVHTTVTNLIQSLRTRSNECVIPAHCVTTVAILVIFQSIFANLSEDIKSKKALVDATD